jgi:TolB protein
MTPKKDFKSGSLGLMAVLALTSAPASAQFEITVRSGVARPIPMAVVPFGWEGSASQGAPFDLAGLVGTDLRNTGRFDTIPVANMVSRPTEPSQVNFNDWRILNVDIVVIGRLIETGPATYQAVFQLFDVLRGEQLLGFRLSTSGENLRATGHRIADMIYEELVGIPGVFSTQIAYVNEQRDAAGQRRYQLIVADADGENSQVIADSPQPIMSPAWSPDGRRLAYVSFEGEQSAIFVQTLRTGTRQRVSARAGVNNAPVFSPDGRMLALTLSLTEGNLDIYTLDLTNQVLRRITDHSAIDTEPEWSPNGDVIYFTSGRLGNPQVYSVPSEPGGRVRRVTYEGTYNARPRISPDGSTLTVVTEVGGQYRIATVNPDTGLLIQVLTRGTLDESPSYAPNGAQVIYATMLNGRGVLATVSTDGRVQREIASTAGFVREPVWSPYPRP